MNERSEKNSMNLYDYLYVDLEKVISLYSQLTGGVVELIETQLEKGSGSEHKGSLDLKLFKYGAGGTKEEKEQDKRTVKPHHALLQELERELSSFGCLLDLDELEDEKTLKDHEVRISIKKALCVKCTGRIVIEDYERIKNIGQAFPEVVEFFNNSYFEGNHEYQEIKAEITKLEDSEGNRNQKSAAKRKAKELREQLDKIIATSPLGGVPQWILDGLVTWIDTFLPNITNIRVYPFPDQHDEHLFGHLDASNFTISDPTAFHFTYGSFPTEEFTMIGIITSVPLDEEEGFNPLQEFEKEELNDKETLENAFRGLFEGFEGLEAMIRTCRYPRILVHPILVYRETSSCKD